ncbi:MAG TPA: class I SAM-dependent methyltransferase [Longimicrobiales bacterium]|nr:class I SAM-dependent methyltransferase [Longimicrobiales bacterium]
MNGAMDDARIERERYRERARRALAAPSEAEPALGSAAVPPIFRAPYAAYEQVLREVLRPGQSVLEIGAGAGLHTAALASNGASVVATDVAFESLLLLGRNLGARGACVRAVAADMEALPFRDGAFDVVASAGSLSYGDPTRVDAETARVLRRGGAFVCVDSLDHNPIYRANRWLAYRRGERTASTLRRMPDRRRIEAIGRRFEAVDVRYFGGFTWMMPLVARVVGEAAAARLSDFLDRVAGVRLSAFKFVLVARGLR